MTPAPLFDYNALDSDTREFLQDRASQIRNLARMTAANIVAIGRNLVDVREKLKDEGGFLRWVDSEFGWRRRSAYRFMEVYENPEVAKLANCDIDVSALYLIAAPKTPEPVRMEVVMRAETGEPITHEAVVALRKRYEETGELPESTTALVAMVREAKRDIEASKRSLPSPTEARRIAIETGAHTLDNAGTYQAPMTKADQDRWQADMVRVGTLTDFLKWCPTVRAADITGPIREHHWSSWLSAEMVSAGIDWLNTLREDLYGKAKKAG